MSKEIFYFTTKVGEKEYTRGFNVKKIIRIEPISDDEYNVLLDDLHQRKMKEPILNKKGETTGYKNDVNTYQSEVILTKEQVEKLKQLTNIE